MPPACRTFWLGEGEESWWSWWEAGRESAKDPRHRLPGRQGGPQPRRARIRSVDDIPCDLGLVDWRLHRVNCPTVLTLHPMRRPRLPVGAPSAPTRGNVGCSGSPASDQKRWWTRSSITSEARVGRQVAALADGCPSSPSPGVRDENAKLIETGEPEEDVRHRDAMKPGRRLLLLHHRLPHER